MDRDDLEAVLAIERASFSRPWERSHFEYEIERNPRARNVVVREGLQAMAYAVGWIDDEELTVARIAVHPERRRRGLARLLMTSLLEEARRRGCSTARLEVRASDVGALELYRGLGFVEEGRREGYYEREDAAALLMVASLAPASRPG